MAELATAARPYAQAAFEAASAAGAVSAWDGFLQRAAAVEQDPRVGALIGNPRVRAVELVDFLCGLTDQASARPGDATEQRNFLQLLADNGRLRLLSDIAEQFTRLRADAEHVADVAVVSAFALSETQSQMLAQALERRLRRQVRLHPRIDATLIAGAVVRYGDLVLDGSMRARIERLGVAVGGT